MRMDRNRRGSAVSEELMSELNDGLEIRATVDGVSPAEAAIGGMAAIGGAAAIGAALGAEGLAATVSAKSKATADKSSKTKAAKKAQEGRPDPYLWGIYIAFLVISVVELFSASSN